MDKTRLLWTLVAADVLLSLGSVGAEAFFGWTLPDVLADNRNPGSSGAFHWFLLGVTTLSAFASWVGLVTFWRPARRLYVFALACGVVLALFSGPQVSTSVGVAFSMLNMLVSGVILGLIYFSELARRFERNTVEHSAPAGVSFSTHRS